MLWRGSENTVGVALYRGRVSCVALQAFMPRGAWFSGTQLSLCAVPSAPFSDLCAFVWSVGIFGPSAAVVSRGADARMHPC